MAPTPRARALFALFSLFLLVHPTVAVKQRKVDHVVVLMLENRSFDHMLGFLKALNAKIAGCLPSMGKTCSNPLDPLNASSPRVPVSPDAVYKQVSDPHHDVLDTTEQVYGYGNPNVSSANMQGFIKNYPHGADIMGCFAQEHVPAISTLASEFAIFDQWHAAVPGPTEINRLYVNSATSHGSAYNDDFLLALGYPQRTIFEAIDQSSSNSSWGVYFQLFPTVLFYDYPRGHLDHFGGFDDFKKHAEEGTLPNYTWLEPRYDEILGMPANDQHPDHDVAEGEKLIAEVYSALRNGKNWNSTLFIVTYDEHGGFFDHVAPPTNVPNPDGLNSKKPPFDFTRLGVRVPTIMASPLIPKGTVVGKAPNTAYSHSSMVATVRKLFAPDQAPLTKRDAWADTFDDVLSLESPRTDCPTSLPVPQTHRVIGRGLVAEDQVGSLPISDFSRSIVAVASSLNHNRSITHTGEGLTEAEAYLFVAEETNRFFGRKIVPLN